MSIYHISVYIYKYQCGGSCLLHTNKPNAANTTTTFQYTK